jgi:hypothetical protein
MFVFSIGMNNRAETSAMRVDVASMDLRMRDVASSFCWFSDSSESKRRNNVLLRLDGDCRVRE